MTSVTTKERRSQLVGDVVGITRVIRIETPTGPVDVEVISLDAEQRNTLLDHCLREDGERIDQVKFQPALIIATAHDPDTHEPLFSEADREMLNRLPAGYLDPIIKVASELSALGQGFKETAEKNSGGTTAAASSSPSRANSE